MAAAAESASKATPLALAFLNEHRKNRVERAGRTDTMSALHAVVLTEKPTPEVLERITSLVRSMSNSEKVYGLSQLLTLDYEDYPLLTYALAELCNPKVPGNLLRTIHESLGSDLFLDSDFRAYLLFFTAGNLEPVDADRWECLKSVQRDLALCGGTMMADNLADILGVLVKGYGQNKRPNSNVLESLGRSREILDAALNALGMALVDKARDFTHPEVAAGGAAAEAAVSSAAEDAAGPSI